MKILISKNNEYLASLQGMTDVLSGGSVTINGQSFDIVPVEVKEIPEGAADCQYIYDNGTLVENPEYVSDDVSTRLDDIEQILIELLDTM